MQYIGVAATARASFAPYNSYSDIDVLIEAINEAHSKFA
jgi:selenocysteine lyase/cysteine desulfurase